ncbi:hypothetical protein IFM89_022477 [Coptis chinensis]|uniref:BED-type domain-containing protein n=1 Tax=Coptis chinensis TaxID=261450 RepID=A0A835IAA9_9MAGN|nr:hypothetical protein IFM89_022477 [Coptis chinensis]
MMTVTTSNEPDTPEVEPNKRRRKKSIVWEHFTVEDVGSGCTRACCKQCKQTFAYSTGTKLSGTSHLKRHIGLGICLASRRKEKNQLRSSSTGSAGTGNVTYPPRRQSNGSYWSVNAPFDQELCRHEIAKMIIMHDYPLHMVGHPAFISFVKSLQPTFNLVDCDTVQGDFGICLSDWGLENKLFSLTFNKSIFGNNTGSLRAYLSVKNPLTLKSQLLIEHCYAQVLSSIAQDALGLMEGTVSKVRESIKYVKTSRTREEKFLELKHKLQVPSTKCLFLDDQTEWNTTYLMLVASTELKEVFSCLDTADLEYKLTLTMDDWKQIETLYVELPKSSGV